MRAMAAAMAGIMLVGGCAATAPARPLTPQEARMRAQSADFKRTIAEGVGIGMLAGAATGAGIGAAAYGKDRGQGAIVGAIIGGVMGGIAGGIAGNYYAQKKQAYANEEMRLDAIIADLQAQNTSLAQLVDATRTVVQADQQKLDRIQQDLAAQRITRAEADRQLAAIDDNRRVLDQTVRDLQKRKSEWLEVAAEARTDTSSARIASLDAEIATLESRIAEMQTELDALNSRRASVVG
jgi:outer membrane murein-binding lipoprotein Lpp